LIKRRKKQEEAARKQEEEEIGCFFVASSLFLSVIK
jgi:hypothetical protein